ncbi:hypothetical protein FB451DRAFT_1258607, partial [Mycena latifolia]
MFLKPIFTAIFTILVLGQSAFSAPQAATCGGPGDPPCRKHEFRFEHSYSPPISFAGPGIKKCCSLKSLSPTAGGNICLPECPG